MLTKGFFQALRPKRGTGQVISATSGSSTESANAVSDGIKILKLAADQDMWIDIEPAAIADATASTSMFLAGDKLDRYFACSPGDKVSARAVSTSGSVWVTEMTR